MKKFLKKYDSSRVYNMDEFAVVFGIQGTLSCLTLTGKLKVLTEKGQRSVRCRKSGSRKRITGTCIRFMLQPGVFCANAAGEHIQPMFILKRKNAAKKMTIPDDFESINATVFGYLSLNCRLWVNAVLGRTVRQ